MNSKAIIGVLILMVVVSPGCVRTEPGSTESVYFSGTINASESGFHMNGTVKIGGGLNERDYFRDVSVTLYLENGTKIRSKRIGNLNESRGGLNVTLSTNRIPYYITFESPDFRGRNIEVNYYERVDTFEYSVKTAKSQGELPPKVQ